MTTGAVAALWPRVRLTAEIWLWRHGVAWPLSAALLLTAGGVWVGAVLPARDGAVRPIPSQLDGTAWGPADHERAQAAPALDEPASSWQSTRATWPTLGTGPRDVALHELTHSLLDKADQAGVRLPQGDHQYRARPELGALQVTLVTPLQGRYADIRRLVEAMLRAHPNVALEELSLKRDTVAADTIEVKARWSAWYALDAPPRPKESP